MNKLEYSIPKYNKSEFTCDHCHKLTFHYCYIWSLLADECHYPFDLIKYDEYNFNVNWFNNVIVESSSPVTLGIGKSLDSTSHPLSKKIIKDKGECRIQFVTRICSKCAHNTYFEVINPRIIKDEEYKPQATQIYPRTSTIELFPNEDMSEEEKQLFNEAKDIFDISPKAAGALLRSVIERILRDKFQEKYSKSFLGEILSKPEVKNALSNEIIQLCETCKLIGNDASHSSLIIYEDESRAQVELLFELINEIAEELLSKPRKRQEMLDKSKKINEPKK